MSKGNPLDAVVKFIETQGYKDVIAERLAAHTETARTAFKLSETEVAAKLEQQVFALAFTAVLEDLMSRDLPDGTNVTDAFLKRHGWKLAGPAKRQLQAVRESHIGLYEIVTIQPGTGVTLRDMLQEGNSITVEAPALAGALPVGCELAARVLHWDGRATLGGTLLPFEEKAGTAAAAAVRGAADLAAAVTGFWLRKVLEEQLAPTDATETRMTDDARLAGPEDEERIPEEDFETDEPADEERDGEEDEDEEDFEDEADAEGEEGDVERP